MSVPPAMQRTIKVPIRFDNNAELAAVQATANYQQDLRMARSIKPSVSKGKPNYILPGLALAFATFFLSFNLLMINNQQKDKSVLGESSEGEVVVSSSVKVVEREETNTDTYLKLVAVKREVVKQQQQDLEKYKQDLLVQRANILNSNQSAASELGLSLNSSNSEVINSIDIKLASIKSQLDAFSQMEMKLIANQELSSQEKLILLSPKA